MKMSSMMSLMMSLMMSRMGLPEQVRFRMCLEEPDSAHSLRADPDSTQLDMILHTGLFEDSSLSTTETAEPQSRSLQATPASFRVQRERKPHTGLHSPSCSTSRSPAQRLSPPTSLTPGSGEKQESRVLH